MREPSLKPRMITPQNGSTPPRCAPHGSAAPAPDLLGYRCGLTEPTGERFDPCFVPGLTPSGSSRSRLRRQAPDRLPRRISPAPSCALDRLRETSRSSALGLACRVTRQWSKVAAWGISACEASVQQDTGRKQASGNAAARGQCREATASRFAPDSPLEEGDTNPRSPFDRNDGFRSNSPACLLPERDSPSNPTCTPGELTSEFRGCG